MSGAVLHAMPGITLADTRAMDWHELIAWWGEARLIIEGPKKD
ncbi:hypothetical protein [Kaistia sp. MMO-174]